MAQVKVIETNKGTALIQWVDEEGNRRRSFVPAELVEGEECQSPEQGIPYGEEWENLLPTITPQEIANELRKHGLWTARDLLLRPQAIKAAVGSLATKKLEQALSLAREQRK